MITNTMNEYIQEKISEFETEYKQAVVENPWSDKEEFNTVEDGYPLQWSKQFLKDSLTESYNRGVEDSLSKVVEKKKWLGSDKIEIADGYNQAITETIDNISKLLTNK